MIKFVKNKDNKILCKKDNKIIAFIGGVDNNKVFYAFGKPSQGCYIGFNVDTVETAKSRILENIMGIY